MSTPVKTLLFVLLVVFLYSMISQFKLLMFSNMLVGFLVGAPFWLYVGRRKPRNTD